MMDVFSSAALSALSASPPPLNRALSGIFGSISLAAWICLLLPQLITNYKAQSAEGLSMAFLFVWLLGDMSNLSGALFTHLAPTAIALASYFCFADLILISQCTYYNLKNSRRRSRVSAEPLSGHPSERTPLVRQRSSSVGLPGSLRRHSLHRESSLDPLRKVITGEDETPDNRPWLHNTVSLLAVYTVGTLGWFISYRLGAWDSDVPDVSGDGSGTTTAGLVLGYASAVCYLFARIPQIIKNYREKSCEGLALLFFLLSLTGNMTYGLSLIAYSQEKEDLIKALPWLLGSLGTMVEDCIIFVQFRIYSPRRVSARV